jgi:hypothetical protein
MHDLFMVGLPLTAVLAGIFFNNARFDRLEGRLGRMQADLEHFSYCYVPACIRPERLFLMENPRRHLRSDSDL